MIMADTTHLTALHVRLCSERERLKNARTKKEIELRKVYVAQIEKEIEGEMKFLGMTNAPLPVLSDDDIMRELGL